MGKSKKEELKKLYEGSGVTPRTSEDAWKEGERVGTTLFRKLPVDVIEVDPQVRTTMDEEKIQELVESIKSVGLINPIEVAPKLKEMGKYKLVTGHRRLEAVKRLGWKEIPVLIRFNVRDKDRPIRQLVENLQREDLDPFDEALAYAKLNEAGYSHAQIAEIIGKSKSEVTNSIKLLSLILKRFDVKPTELSGDLIGKVKGEFSGIPKNVLVALAYMTESPLFEEALKMAKAGATVRQIRAIKTRGVDAKQEGAKRRRLLSASYTPYGIIKYEERALELDTLHKIEDAMKEVRQKIEKVIPEGLQVKNLVITISSSKRERINE